MIKFLNHKHSKSFNLASTQKKYVKLIIQLEKKALGYCIYKRTFFQIRRVVASKVKHVLYNAVYHKHYNK